MAEEKKKIEEEEDVEGHRAKGHLGETEDDVEGHRGRKLDDEDDVEGHRQTHR